MDEEKSMEIEALQAIYMDDFKVLEEHPYLKIEIKLLPGSPGDEAFVGTTLEVVYTPNYPKEVPKLLLRDSVGIKDSNLDFLTKKIHSIAEESLGSAMVFNLASAVKEWLDDNNVSEEEVLKKERQKIIEEAEQKRLHGTPVTIETFQSWAKDFYARLESQKKEIQKAANKKLTGRQMFEMNASLATSDATPESGEVAVDWNLFSKELEDAELEEFEDKDE